MRKVVVKRGYEKVYENEVLVSKTPVGELEEEYGDTELDDSSPRDE